MRSMRARCAATSSRAEHAAGAQCARLLGRASAGRARRSVSGSWQRHAIGASRAYVRVPAPVVTGSGPIRREVARRARPVRIAPVTVNRSSPCPSRAVARSRGRARPRIASRPSSRRCARPGRPDPAAAIVREASERGSDLIVLSDAACAIAPSSCSPTSPTACPTRRAAASSSSPQLGPRTDDQLPERLLGRATEIGGSPATACAIRRRAVVAQAVAGEDAADLGGAPEQPLARLMRRCGARAMETKTTLQRAACETRLATLASRNSVRSRMPASESTIRSLPRWLASRTIAAAGSGSAGSSASTVSSASKRSAASRAHVTARPLGSGTARILLTVTRPILTARRAPREDSAGAAERSPVTAGAQRAHDTRVRANRIRGNRRRVERRALLA